MHKHDTTITVHAYRPSTVSKEITYIVTIYGYLPPKATGIFPLVTIYLNPKYQHNSRHYMYRGETFRRNDKIPAGGRISAPRLVVGIALSAFPETPER